MAVGRVNSVAHNFGHHFLWFRRGFIYSHLARTASRAGIGCCTINILQEEVHPSLLDTSVFRHVISELRSQFYRCLDSVVVDHDYVTDAEITIDTGDYPARRCRCTIRDRYGHHYSREVVIEGSANQTVERAGAPPLHSDPQ